MNDETIRLFLAALGKALVETFGDLPAHPAAPAPLPALVQEPVKAESAPEDLPKRKVFIAKTFVCSDCGRRFEANAPHAKRCPECRNKFRGRSWWSSATGSGRTSTCGMDRHKTLTWCTATALICKEER